ncbi:thiamine phosphate synthase [Methanocella sp. CWC-04]|uniref:Thiamine-phosphate synthase n=1 Tax=Methanooceanicella nereidis TaxID=2052831 RepID=A0AAP2RF79_9EURY|nr:thiamine phosphate synthase [Methanocella sp. CWC-04]MCD1295127.1 thiamine phosphate synthase [Methanocella sp. CWC-04]
MIYGLYVITDERLSRGLSHVELARRAIAGGADVIQLRDKEKSGKELTGYALEISRIAKKAGVLFIVNDRLDIALISGAGGVHLGQDDIPAVLARKIAPPGFIIGVSTGTVEEAIKAEQDGADYIGVGPVYTTSSKIDAGPVCGIGLLKEIKSRVSIPVVAIGGINKNNLTETLDTGVDGVAVISAVVSQEDVEKATKELKALIQNINA